MPDPSIIPGDFFAPASYSADDISNMVSSAAKKYGVDPGLALRVAKTESAYSGTAVSPKGAIGPMQLMPDTATGLGVDDIHDPAQNIEGGMRYLRDLLGHYGGDTDKAVAAYNAGPGRVDSGKPLPAETQAYVRKVNPGNGIPSDFFGDTGSAQNGSIPADFFNEAAPATAAPMPLGVPQLEPAIGPSVAQAVRTDTPAQLQAAMDDADKDRADNMPPRTGPQIGAEETPPARPPLISSKIGRVSGPQAAQMAVRSDIQGNAPTAATAGVMGGIRQLAEPIATAAPAPIADYLTKPLVRAFTGEAAYPITADDALRMVPIPNGSGGMTPVPLDTIKAIGNTAGGFISADNLAVMLATGYGAAAVKAAANLPRVVEALKGASPAVQKAFDMAASGAVPALVTGQGVTGAVEAGHEAYQTDDPQTRRVKTVEALTSLAMAAGSAAWGAHEVSETAGSYPAGGVPGETSLTRVINDAAGNPTVFTSAAQRQNRFLTAQAETERLTQGGRNLAAQVWANQAEQLKTQAAAPLSRAFTEPVPVMVNGVLHSIEYAGSSSPTSSASVPSPLFKLVNTVTGETATSGEAGSVSAFLQAHGAVPAVNSGDTIATTLDQRYSDIVAQRAEAQSAADKAKNAGKRDLFAEAAMQDADAQLSDIQKLRSHLGAEGTQLPASRRNAPEQAPATDTGVAGAAPTTQSSPTVDYSQQPPPVVEPRPLQPQDIVPGESYPFTTGTVTVKSIDNGMVRYEHEGPGGQITKRSTPISVFLKGIKTPEEDKSQEQKSDVDAAPAVPSVAGTTVPPNGTPEPGSAVLPQGVAEQPHTQIPPELLTAQNQGLANPPQSGEDEMEAARRGGPVTDTSGAPGSPDFVNAGPLAARPAPGAPTGAPAIPAQHGPLTPGFPVAAPGQAPATDTAVAGAAPTPEPFDFASTQVNLPQSASKNILNFGKTIPARILAPEAGHATAGETGSTGLETQPHITLKYGLHGEDPAAVQQLLANEGPISATLGRASLFHTDDADVLKVDVDSPNLHRLNGIVAQLPHTDTHPTYQPHVTIAYLKKGEGAKYDGKSIPGVTGQTVSFDSVAFSDKSGNQTQIPLNGPQQAPAPGRLTGAAPTSELSGIEQSTEQLPSTVPQVPSVPSQESTINAETNGPNPQAGREQQGQGPALQETPSGIRPERTGNATSVLISGEDTEHPAVYGLRELSELRASHHPFSFQREPEYPYTNDRDYTKLENQKRVIGQAQRFNPRFLVTDAPDATHGPPVVDVHGNAIGGNSRTMTLQRIYASNPAAADNYKRTLTANAAHYGIDPAQIAQMKQPVLVREVSPKDAIEVQRAITDMNKTGTAAMGPNERALVDSRRISPDTLEYIEHKINQMEDGSLGKVLATDAGPEILNRLVGDGAITEQESPQYISDGKLTPEGKTRLNRLMIGRFFSGVKEMDETPQAIKGKLEKIVSPLARIAQRPEWDVFTQPIREALSLMEAARQNDIQVKYETLDKQQGMFGRRAFSPDAYKWAYVLRNNSGKALADAFKGYASLEALSRPDTTIGMFAAAPVSQAEAFAQTVGKLRDINRVLDLEPASLASRISGERGPIFNEFHHDEQGATNALKAAQTGDAIGALQDKNLGYGDIDLVWGYPGDGPPLWKRGYGLAHILVRHPWIEGHLQEMLDRMTEKEQQGPDRVRLSNKQGEKAVLATTWFGRENKTWLLTEYDNRPPATGGTLDGSGNPEASGPTSPLTGGQPRPAGERSFTPSNPDEGTGEAHSPERGSNSPAPATRIRVGEAAPELQTGTGPTPPATGELNSTIAPQEGEVKQPGTPGNTGEPSSLASRVMPGFYSQLERTIESKMPAKAPVPQILGIIDNPQNGAKPDEIKWTGLRDWLVQQKGVVSKQQVLDFLKQNEVAVQEVEHAGVGKDADLRRIEDEISLSMTRLTVDAQSHGMNQLDAANLPGRLFDGSLDSESLPEPLRADARRLVEQHRHATEARAALDSAGGAAKYASYVLPGGKNYRELLLTLPQQHGDPLDTFLSSMREKYGLADPLNRLDAAEYERYTELREAARKSGAYAKPFASPHWDEPNVLAHVRFNDRTDADGKRDLHVEEIQSDWHQQGRAKGYKGLTPAEATEAARIKAKGGAITQDEIDWYNRVVNDRERSGVPAAPFAKTWHELAFKRMLRWAAENGYDRLTWTTGEQQARRYDLSKQVDSVHYSPEEKRLWAVKDGRNVVNKTGIWPGEIPDYIGKDLARKLSESPVDAGTHDRQSVSGPDLKIGGEGMKGFYDKILPEFASRYGKKWGAKAGTTKITTGKKNKRVLDQILREDFGTDWGTATPEQQHRAIEIQNGELSGQVNPWAVMRDGRIVDAFANQHSATAYASEHGGNVEYRGRGEKVHAIDITPPMRESVMQGQPLFARDAGMQRPQPGKSGQFNPADIARWVNSSRSELSEHEGMPVLYLNAPAMDVVLRAKSQIASGETSSNTGGLALTRAGITNLLEEARYARKQIAAGTGMPYDHALDAIAQQVEQAIQHPGFVGALPIAQAARGNGWESEGITSAQTSRWLREEIDHARQYAVAEQQIRKFLPPEFWDHPAAHKAAEELAKRGYAPLSKEGPFAEHNNAVMGMEIGVRLMRPGLLKELGLTPQEALDLAEHYANLLEKTHDGRARQIVQQTRAAFGIDAGRSGRLAEEHAESAQPAQRQGAPRVPGEPVSGVRPESSPTGVTPQSFAEVVSRHESGTLPSFKLNPQSDAAKRADFLREYARMSPEERQAKWLGEFNSLGLSPAPFWLSKPGGLKPAKQRPGQDTLFARKPAPAPGRFGVPAASAGRAAANNQPDLFESAQDRSGASSNIVHIEKNEKDGVEAVVASIPSAKFGGRGYSVALRDTDSGEYLPDVRIYKTEAEARQKAKEWAGTSLFGGAERQSRIDAERYRNQILHDQLTAQLASGQAAKPTKLKPAQNRGLFEEEGPEQGGLFSRKWRPAADAAAADAASNKNLSASESKQAKRLATLFADLTPVKESTISKMGGPGLWISPEGKTIPLIGENGIATHGQTAMKITGAKDAVSATSKLLNQGYIRVRGGSLQLGRPPVSFDAILGNALKAAKAGAPGQDIHIDTPEGHASIPPHETGQFLANPQAYLHVSTRAMLLSRGGDLPSGPLSIRRIDTEPYDPNATQALTEAEGRADYQPPKGDVEATLWVNRQAYVTLFQALGQPVDLEHHGATFEVEHSRHTLAGLDARIAQASGETRKALADLRRLLYRAAGLDGAARPVAIVQSGPEMSHAEIQAAAEEEWDHIRGLRLGGTVEGLVDSYGDLRELAPREFAEAERGLKARGYNDPDHYAHEVFVRLIRPGKYRELGVSEQEAGKLAAAFAIILERTHGESANDIIDDIYAAQRLPRPAGAGSIGGASQDVAPAPGRGAGRTEWRRPPGYRGAPLSARGPGEIRPSLGGLQPGDDDLLTKLQSAQEAVRNLPDDHIQQATEDENIGGLLQEMHGRLGEDYNTYEEAVKYAKEGNAAAWRATMRGGLEDAANWIQYLQEQPPASAVPSPPPTPGSFKAELANASAALAAVKDNLLMLLAPAARTGAKPAALSVRYRAAEMARVQAQTEKALEAAGRALGRMPVEDRWDFYDRVERGAPEPDATLNGIAQVFRQVLDSAREDVRNLGTGKLDSFIQNYLPHFYKDADRAAQIFTEYYAKSPMEGSKAFLKRRKFETLKDAMEAGLEPISDDPVEMVLMKVREMQKYVMAHRVMNDGKAQGWLKYIPATAQKPAGFTWIDDKVATVFGPKFGAVKLPPGETMADEPVMWNYKKGTHEPLDPNQVQVFGTRVMGRYAGPEAAATIVNNYLSPGLRRYALYRGYIGLANSMNQFQLGFSAFHLGFTTMDAAISKTALGIYQTAHGHPVQGLVSAAMTPLAPFTGIVKGEKMLREYYRPGSQAEEIGKLVDAMVLAGGRAKMDSFYQTEITKHMLDAIRQMSPTRRVLGALGGAAAGGFVAGPVGAGVGATLGLAGALRLPFAIAEQVSRPILEWAVPRQKMAVFADLARFELRRAQEGNWTPEQTQDALAKAWDSVDNRMGQLVYDNLFWNKIFKDLLMGSVRSVGWDTGTIREILGGAGDTRKLLRAPFGSGPKPDVTTRLSYLLALPLVAGLVGALIYYLYHGKAPEHPIDYYAPKDSHGNRIWLPTYMKDIMAAGAKGPWEVAKGKIHPFLTAVAEMLGNEDYWHRPIVHWNAHAGKVLEDLRKEVLKQYTPMAVRKPTGKHAAPKGLDEKLLPFVGVTRAPAYVEGAHRTP